LKTVNTAELKGWLLQLVVQEYFVHNRKSMHRRKPYADLINVCVNYQRLDAHLWTQGQYDLDAWVIFMDIRLHVQL